MMNFFDDNQKIGIGLISIGVLFYVLGVMWFLDRGLLCIGNFAFLMGLCSMIGPQFTLEFFMRKTKRKGSIFYLGGFILIIIGLPFFTLAGWLCQMYGTLLLFKSFIGQIFSHAKSLPVIGQPMADSTMMCSVIEYLSGDQGKKGLGGQKMMEV